MLRWNLTRVSRVRVSVFWFVCVGWDLLCVSVGVCALFCLGPRSLTTVLWGDAADRRGADEEGKQP